MKKICLFLIIFSMISSLSLPVYAQNSSWINTGFTSPSWIYADNWSLGIIPGATSATTNTDVATFNTSIGFNDYGSSTTPIIIDSGRNIGGISFDTAAGDYTIGSTVLDPLYLTSGGTIQILSTLTSTNAIETINSPLVLEGNYTFSNNSASGSGAGAGTLDLGGSITSAASSGTTVLTLGGTNANLNTLSGIISNGGGSNTVGVTQTGGTWVLSGTNTYTGGTTLSAGTMIASNTQALGTSASALSLGGGTLDLATDSSITAYNTTVSGNTTIISDLATSGSGITQTLGTLSLGADTLTVNAGSNVASGVAGLTFGDTTLTASGATFTANSGTLLTLGAISGSGDDFTVSGSGNTDIIDVIGTGSGTLTKSGTGTLTLTGANTYSGTTTISGGTLQIGNGSSSGSLGSGSVTDNGNLTFDLSSSPTVSNTISGTGSVTQNFTGSTVTLSGPNTYSGATIVTAGTLEAGAVNQAFGLGSAVAVAVGGTLDLGGYNETIGSLAGAGTVTNSGITSPAILTTGGNNSTLFSGTIEDGASSIGLIKTGSGTLTLTGSNIYGGSTIISAGILNIQNADALGIGAGGASVTSGATLQLQGGITTPAVSLTLNGTGVNSNGALENISGNNTYAGLVTLGSAAQINSDSGTLTLSNTGTMTGSGYNFIIGGSGNTTINSIIGTGAGTLTKEGSGTLTLTGVNTYTGSTTLDNGILNVVTGAMGSGTIYFYGGTLQYASGNSTDYSGQFSPLTGQAFNIDTNGQSVIFASAIGSGTSDSLTKIGSGTLTLTTANSYTGGTTVNGGTLTIGAGGSLNSTGALSVNNTNTGAGNNVLMNLSTSASTTTGSLSGSIATPSSGANTATINNEGQAFTANQTTNGTYAGVIEGAGSFTLGSSSTSSLTLSGDNTYSGGTMINAGTLQVENANALGTGAVVNNAILNLGTINLSLSAAYTQNMNSVLDLTIASPSSFGSITSPGHTAVINSSSTINVSVGGYIPSNSTFDIINTAGAGVGADPSTITSNSPLVSFSSSISGNNLVLIADNSGFAPLANNPNAHAVGTVLDTIPNPSSDMTNVLNTLEVLSDTNESKITSALNTMGPVVDRGVIQNSSSSLNNLVSATLDRIQNILDHSLSGNSLGTGISSGDVTEPNGIWAKPYGSYLTQGTLQGIQGYDAWNAGTAVGYDHMITDGLIVGVSGGYGYGQVESDVNNANTEINSAQGTLYAGYQDPNLNYFIDAEGSFAWDWYDGQRDIIVGSLNRTADANYNGQQYGAFLEGGYKFNIGESLKLTPLASIQWSHLSLDRYTETNAGALDLNVNSQDYDRLESGVGASISYTEELVWGNFTPELHAKWLYDYINDNMVVTSSFTGGGGSFTSNGATPAKEGADIGGKLSFDFFNNFSLIAQADAELKNGFLGIYGSGTVRYKF